MRDLKPWLALILRRPGRLLAGALLILLTLLAGMGLLALSGWFLTATAITGLMLAAGVQAYVNLYVPGGGIRLFAVTRTVARYAERVYNHDTVLRLLADIRIRLFTRLSASNTASRARLRGPEWLSRLTSDVDTLDTLYLRLLAPAGLAVLVTGVVVGGAWLLGDGELAAVLGGLLVLALILTTVLVSLRTQRLTLKRADDLDRVRTTVVEHLEGFGELTAAGRAGKHGARLCRLAGSVARDQAIADQRIGWHLAGSGVLVNLAAVAALWFGLGLFNRDAMTGPVVVLLPLAVLGLAEIYSTLPDAFGRMGAMLGAARRLNRDCGSDTGSDSATSNHADKGIQTATDGAGTGDHAVILADVTVRFGAQPPLLKHYSLMVNAGDRLGVVGPSGSGKSSIADLIVGLQTATCGTVTAAPCAYLTQASVLFDDTLKSNLLIGNPQASDLDLWRILEAVAMADRFAALPRQLNTWLGAYGHQLSGGEARRIALARTLLSQRSLLVLDEPFTGVDDASRERIARAIDPWLDGKTVIALGHGPEALPGFDRIVRL